MTDNFRDGPGGPGRINFSGLAAARASESGFRLAEQPFEMFFPNGGKRVRAVSARPVAPGYDYRLTSLHEPNVPLEDVELGRIDEVVFKVDRQERNNDPLQSRPGS